MPGAKEVRGLAINTGTGVFEERTIPLRRRGPNDSLIEPIAVTLCGTDLGLINRDHGEPVRGGTILVPGHEAVARVTRTPKTGGLEEGDLVSVMVRHPDRSIRQHELHRRYPDEFHVPGRWREHGIYGQHGSLQGAEVLPTEQLVKLPNGIPTPVLCLSEPLSAVSKLVRKMEAHNYLTFPELRNSSDQHYPVLIIGAGCSGLMALLAFKYSEAKSHGKKSFDITVIDGVEHDSPKARLVSALGGTYKKLLLNSAEQAEALRAEHGRELWRGHRYVLEAAGSGVAQELGSLALGDSGIIGRFGIPHGHNEFVDSGVNERAVQRVLRNITDLGSVNAHNGTDWPHAIRAIKWAYHRYGPILTEIVNREIDGFDPKAVRSALEDSSVVRAIVSIPKESRPR